MSSWPPLLSSAEVSFTIVRVIPRTVFVRATHYYYAEERGSKPGSQEDMNYGRGPVAVSFYLHWDTFFAYTFEICCTYSL